MPRLASLARFALACSLVLACRSEPKPQHRKAETEATPRASKPKLEVWQRPGVAMPDAFAPFPTPALADLVGAWVVASDIPQQRELWLIEEQGRKLTIVEVGGRKRVHGLSLHSPCTLALVDDGGRKQTRPFVRIGEQFFVHPEGVAGLSSAEGQHLACTRRTTTIVPPSGPCRGFDEMLGVWSELGAPPDACMLEIIAAPPAAADSPPPSAPPPTLVIGEQRLTQREGAWLNPTLAASEALRVADEAAGLALLERPVEVAPPSEAPPSEAPPSEAPPAPAPAPG